MKIIRINLDDTMDEIDTEDSILEYFINKNIQDIRELYIWKYQNNIIKAYGSYTNSYSDINKHILPPNGISHVFNDNSNDIEIYSDIYIVAFDENNKQIDYQISEYGNFYYVMNEQNNFEEDDNISVNSDTNIIEDTIKPNKNIPNIINTNNNILNYDYNTY
tara:strand:+ start:2335 stop:2820 length:486 start_codon:yes stop_codon:yes gene_type:complete